MKEAQASVKVVFVVEGKNKELKYLSSLVLLNVIYTLKRWIYIEWCVYLHIMVSLDTNNFPSVEMLQKLIFSWCVCQPSKTLLGNK